ncbi:MAG: hypothetical protein EZS28_026669 [Streblomastix strix]|uniref:OTU domain-containing protein n=1 Tax=Streblomastix strix TaxID=222440 RepID=A0A5J4V6U4_9EUKA|nr:MAG: hypothetical protein EZS28_026669 [Streblomastix strix]
MKNSAKVDRYKINDEFQRLQTEVEELGAYLRNNRGEGNCLFHAIADQLRIQGVNADTIRREACNYVLQHLQQAQGFFTDGESPVQYAHQTSNDGVQGDGRIFWAICAFYHIRIRVRMVGGITFEEGNQNDRVVEIGYLANIHYVSIRYD